MEFLTSPVQSIMGATEKRRSNLFILNEISGIVGPVVHGTDIYSRDGAVARKSPGLRLT